MLKTGESSVTYAYTGNYQFAAVYGSGPFGGCAYNTACSTTSANGGLVNTGIAVAGIVTLACLIVLAAVLVRVWRRPSKKFPKGAPVDKNQDTTQR